MKFMNEFNNSEFLSLVNYIEEFLSSVIFIRGTRSICIEYVNFLKWSDLQVQNLNKLNFKIDIK